MEGTIASFRMGRHTQYDNQMIMVVNGVDTKEKASKLMGKTVVWATPSKKEKREIKGKITKEHGSKGAVRVLFEKGMPGQSITNKVRIE